MNFIDPHQAFADFFNDKRIRALAYGLSKKVTEGHLCLNVENYNKEVTSHLDILKESGAEPPRYPKLIDEKDLQNCDDILYTQQESDIVKPFVYENGNYYLSRYWSYEKNILQRIESLIADSFFNLNLIEDEKLFIHTLFSTDEKIIDWQLIAVLSSLLRRFSIITGGPGTGKTTTISKLLAIVLKIDPNLKIALAAPTGKAAVRMNESLNNSINDKLYGLKAPDEIKSKIGNLSAETIHRLLGWKEGTHYFKHNRNNPLSHNIVVVDEASMIDASLMSKLLDAIPDNGKLILLGDKNQLASVEAGSVFGDLCRTQGKRVNNLSQDIINLYTKLQGYGDLSDYMGEVNQLSRSIIELMISRRFSDDEGIGKFSKAVISEDTEILKDSEFYTPTPDKESVEIVDDYNIITQYYSLYKDYLSEPDIDKALKLFDNFRVLTATNDDQYGVNIYNRKIEDYLGLNRGDEPFYHNQPVMITKNNHQLGIYNGDIGIIREDDGKLYLYFSAEKRVSVVHIDDYKTAFAMTIHKSQGSEFREVAIIIPETESKILSKELLYTAITRAKKRAIIAAKPEVLKPIIQKGVERVSGI